MKRFGATSAGWSDEAEIINQSSSSASSIAIQTERTLIAAILQQAVDDCLGGKGNVETGDDPGKAYLWMMNSPECEAYCGWLDINYERFRAGVVKLCGERCEAYLKFRRACAEAQNLLRSEATSLPARRSRPKKRRAKAI